MTRISCTIQTLTPIYTGGITGSADRVYETGLIGSLRSWHETIMRGLGAHICDPTQRPCLLNEKEFRSQPSSLSLSERLRNAGLCPSCQLFGATGWRRRFSLRVSDDTTRSTWPHDLFLNIRPSDRRRGWYLPPGRTGRFTLKLRGETNALARLATLFLFLERYGSLGAKPQLGYGKFRILDRTALGQLQHTFTESDRGARASRADPFLPTLDRFIFFSYRFIPSEPEWWMQLDGIRRLLADRRRRTILHDLERAKMIPITPLLKNYWRYRRWNAPGVTKRWIMGTSHRGRLRSKLAASWAFCPDPASSSDPDHEWQLDGWAWLTQERQTDYGPRSIRRDIARLEALICNDDEWRRALALPIGSRTQLRITEPGELGAVRALIDDDIDNDNDNEREGPV